jgi:1-acyl-sn-glycerol-3-phosphate acyltransferase
VTNEKSNFIQQGLGGRIFFRVVRDLAMLLCRVYFRVTINGLENVPKHGAWVTAPNHRSNLDILIAGNCTRRRQRYMGKHTLWAKEPFAWILSQLGGFPVTRGTVDREALQRCLDLVNAGQPLVLYPEGTRLSGPNIGKLFDGVAYVAIKTQVPILPVGIAGTERAMAKGSKFIRPVRVHLEIGPPMMPPAAIDGRRVSRDLMHQVTEELQVEMQRLFDIAQARVN